MQEVVQLSITITHVESVSLKEEKFGLSFFRFLPLERTETVATDHLLVSDEAVRVLDQPLR